MVPSPSSGAIVVEDNEVQRLGFTWRRGIGHGTEVGVESALLWRNGGFMDPLLSGYHSLAVRTGNSFADGVGSTATFGYKRLLDRSHILALSFSENGDTHNYTLPYFSNVGPDFTVTANLEWRH